MIKRGVEGIAPIRIQNDAKLDSLYFGIELPFHMDLITVQFQHFS